jgi:hypothetical protein
MVRRCLVLVAIAALTVLATGGCEGLRQAIRSGGDGQANLKSKAYTPGTSAIESDPTKLQAVDSTDKNPQPFFQNNRSSGGWSSQAREIESHLGVGP